MPYLYTPKNMLRMMKNLWSAPVSLFLILIIALTFSSCNPVKKYRDNMALSERYQTENQRLLQEKEQLHGQLQACEEQLIAGRARAAMLQQDTVRLFTSLEEEVKRNRQLSQTNELLLQKNRELLSDNRIQTERISTELLQTQEQLIRKEDALKKLESDLTKLQEQLTAKEATLNQSESDLTRFRSEVEASRAELMAAQKALASSQKELALKQGRLIELQRILAQKDSTVTALRNTVSGALLGFAGKGLKVEERNGKVYVSMDNKLLFASGSTVVGTEGQKALEELARVLQANPDINILVEGHTDDQPLRGSGQMKDNWDLSVLRATEIVRILLAKGKIDPARITAAGRSEYLPVDKANTADARARNRRTEIILTPKLDELFRVIESN
jgi:chemotaxis protein MotB